jgi:DNA-binding winged helix-turn-helix (wHTH) protein/tetratricopeptide (TPR) repeat protein
VKTSKQARFSSYEFDLATGDLSRYGTRLRLERQPARILGMLIEAGGGLVTREELIAALWPGEVEGNFDRRLDKAVAKLRASLNDDPAAPRFIETLKGRGYRFLVGPEIEFPDPIEGGGLSEEMNEPQPAGQSSEAGPDLPGVQPELHPSPPRAISRPLFTLSRLAAFAALLAAAGGLAWWLRVRPPARVHGRPVLLILGFRDASNSSENAWVSRSVADWLATDLRAGGEVRVVQGADSQALQPRTTPSGCGKLPGSVLETARRAFDADLVVYGDYSATEDSASGERWRLDVCLGSTQDRKDPESMTVIGAKGDIAQLVFNAGELLRSKLGIEQPSSQTLGYLRATLPANPAAARLYAEGASALARFEPEEASAMLAAAVQLEPRHAPTHAALSAAWSALGYQQRSRQEALLARDLARGLSPMQQLEYEGLASEAKNDWPAAVEVYSRLLQLHPDSVEHGLKLAHAQIHANKALLALETLRSLRGRNEAALTDPRADLAEAAADAAISDFRGQLAASTQAEIHARAQGYSLLVADARMNQADADDMLDNWDEALRLWRLAGESYESIGDRGGMADALNREALQAWHKDDAATATKLFEQAMSLSKSIGDQARIAYSLSRLGDLHLYVDPPQGRDTSAAVSLFRRAEAIYHDTENLAEEGNVLSLFGDEAMVRTRYKEAREFYTRAMALSQAANDKSRIANRLLDLGNVAVAEGRIQDAERYFRQSIQAYEALGQQDRVAIVRDCLGGALLQEGRIDQAAPMLEDSLAAMRAIGRRMQAFEVRWDLIRLEMVRNPARAEALARDNIDLSKAVARVGTAGDPTAFAALAEAEARQGKLDEATKAIQQAFAPGQAPVSRGFVPEMLLSRGYVRMSSHDYTGANADFERARHLSLAQGQVHLEMESRLSLAELHVRLKGKDALPELERLRHDADQVGYGIFSIKIDAFLRSLPAAR